MKTKGTLHVTGVARCGESAHELHGMAASMWLAMARRVEGAIYESKEKNRATPGAGHSPGGWRSQARGECPLRNEPRRQFMKEGGGWGKKLAPGRKRS